MNAIADKEVGREQTLGATRLRPFQRIPVAAPWLDAREDAFVREAMSTGAISGFFGEHISRFEREFADFCGCSHGVAVSTGTNGVLVVDDQFPQMIPKIQAAIGELGGKGVNFAVNTHVNP